MPLDRARLSVKFYLERLRSQAAQLAAQDYPSDHPGPEKWLALVRGLLDTADIYLQSSATPRSKQAKDVRDAAELTSEAYHYLSYLRGAGLDELPYPIVSPLQTWFTELEVKTDALFRAELLANYELSPIEAHAFKGVRRPSPSLKKAIKEIEWPIWRVTLPAKALGISTHFAIVAHELGHILFTRIPWDYGPIAHDWNQQRPTLPIASVFLLSIHLCSISLVRSSVTGFRNWHRMPSLFFSLAQHFSSP